MMLPPYRPFREKPSSSVEVSERPAKTGSVVTAGIEPAAAIPAPRMTIRRELVVVARRSKHSMRSMKTGMEPHW